MDHDTEQNIEERLQEAERAAEIANAACEQAIRTELELRRVLDHYQDEEIVRLRREVRILEEKLSTSEGEAS